MNLAEWRAKQAAGQSVELPSGLTVQLRKFSVMDLAMAGDVPDDLDGVVIKFIGGNQVFEKASELNALGRLVRIVAGRALVGPDGLSVDELPGGDLQHIMQWCHQESAGDSFRDRQAGDLGAALHSNGVQSTTVDVA